MEATVNPNKTLQQEQSLGCYHLITLMYEFPSF